MPTVTNVGAFTVSIKATKANYTTKEITINTGKVNYSKASSASGVNKVYNGSAQTGVTGQYVTWGGTTSTTNVGTYTAYATPDSNHAWSDGTRTQKTVQWSITPAEITLDATVYSGTYDGKVHSYISSPTFCRPAILAKNEMPMLDQSCTSSTIPVIYCESRSH